MPEFSTIFRASVPFLPQGDCYLWNPELVWLHFASDCLIAFAYYSIPLMMAYFLSKRRDFPFAWVLWLFSAFIITCGTSHVLAAWTVWHPVYWLSGVVKIVTAFISVFTAIVLLPLMPQALAIPSPAQLEASNHKLEQEIRDRTTAQDQIRLLNAELEQRVNQRTAELQASEERFRLLVEGMRDYALAMLDPQGGVVSWNPGAERIYGYHAEDILGRSFACFYEVEERKQEKPEQSLQQALAEGRFEEEGWRVRQDGSRFWANVVLTPLQDEVGQLRGFSKVTRDATQRKLVQDKLTRLSHAIALTGSAICMSDMTGQSIYHNQAFIDLYGYQVEDLKAYPASSVLYLHPEISKEVFATVTQGGSWCGEVELKHKSGAIVPTLMRADCITDESGNRLGLLSVCTDISERKRVEAALQQTKAELEIRVEERTRELKTVILQLQSEIAQRQKAEAELRALFAAMTDIIVVFDSDGRYLKIAPTNPNQLYKLPSALVGKKVQEVFPPAQAKFFLHHIQEALDSHQPLNIEYSLQIDKQIFWFSGTVSPMLTNTAIWVARDISARKQAEEALEEQLQQTLLLKHITEEIRSSLNTQQIFQTAVTQVGQALGVNRCSIASYVSEPFPQLPMMAEYLEVGYPSIAKLEIPVLGNLHVQALLAQDRAIASDNVYEDFLLQEFGDLSEQIELKSMLAVRTSYQGKPNGLLSVHQCSNFRSWTEEEIELVEAVAAQVGIALAQARLLEQQTQASKQLTDQNLALRQSEARLREKNEQLKEAFRELKQAQAQLIQTEKMSSLGQLVAGIAHEINNPVNFIYGNISHAHAYFKDLLRLLELYEREKTQHAPEIQALITEIDLDFLLQDTPKILNSMKMGAERIREIVASLRNFSRLDEAEMKFADIHEGIDSTLLILQNRLREKPSRPAIAVVKEYGSLPNVECYPGQLNQVFMNILTNAIDVLDAQSPPRTITIHTEIEEREMVVKAEDKGEDTLFHASDLSSHQATPATTHKTENPLTPVQFVVIRIQDNGPGISPEVRRRIFDPFFTTKPVGKGTGLGLSISYQIVVQKHGGALKCISELGQGATFIIEIPVRSK